MSLRAPNIEELDAVSADRPVLIVDSSGHLGAANSAAFRAAGVTASTQDPAGGSVARRSDGASRLWASYGQTTAMECGLGLGNYDISLVRSAIDRQLLPIDLYVCAKDSVTDATIEPASKLAVDHANAGIGNRVRLGGIKFWLDGSLDTAWFTQPYATNPPGKTGHCSGFRQIPDEVLDAAFDKYWATDLQIYMHMNGDAVLRLWGPDRASRGMAAQTLSQAGVPFTFSHDAPVTPQPWILPLVDAGVNRTAASGTVVGRLVAGAALADPLWDTSTWLSEHSVPGQILHALMGYVARPSGMRVVFFLSVASALGVLMKRFDRVPPGLAPVSLVRRPRERSANRRRRNSNP